MKEQINLWVNIGVSAYTPDNERRRIRLMNAAHLVNIPLEIFYVIVTIFAESSPIVNLLNVVLFVLSPISLWLSWKGKHRFNRWLSMLIIPLVMLTFRWYFSDYGATFIQLALIPLAFLVFDSKKSSLYATAYILVCAMFGETIVAHYFPKSDWVTPTINVFMVINLVVSAGLISLILWLFKEDMFRYQKDIEYRNTLLDEQRNHLQVAYTQITASVRYAKRIQTAFLPVESRFKQILPNSFVLYKPRDIVSGDFYWLSQTTLPFLAVADCTGHGVPGAFMTAIGNNLLN